MKTLAGACLILFSAFCVHAQVFNKVTDSPLINDQNNTYEIAWGDFDNDGDLDLFRGTLFASPTNVEERNLLYQNNCNGDFTRIVALPVGIVDDFHPGIGGYWIDYDNDDDLDLYLHHYHFPSEDRGGTGPNVMYQNNGDGTFSKPTTNLNFFAGSAAWADYDNDGFLDVYLGETFLFRNDGAGDFIFIDESPIKDNNSGFYGVSWVDADNDGFMDLYLGSGFSGTSQNFFYHNEGDGSFTQITTDPIVDHSVVSYTSSWGDYDNDLDLDMWLSVAGGPDHLYSNNGDGTFIRVLPTVIGNSTSLNQGGGGWADYDNDGDLDLFVPTFFQNHLFNNNGDGTFTENLSEIVVNDLVVESYGAGWADFDRDGDLDLFVPNAFGNPPDFFYTNTIFENMGNGYHWIHITCKGVISNRDAVGARVFAKAVIDGTPTWQMREINANSTRGGEMGGAAGHIVHIGLRESTIIDSLKIVWPASGITQIFTNVAADRFIEITEGVDAVVDAIDCLPDLLPEEAGIIRGTSFVDIDSNCSKNLLEEVGVGSRILQATDQQGKSFFVLSASGGEYEFRLPPGTYTISIFHTEETQETCNGGAGITYQVSVAAGDTVIGNDFFLSSHCSAEVFIEAVEYPCRPASCPLRADTSCCDTVSFKNRRSGPCPDCATIYCGVWANTGTEVIREGGELSITFGPGTNPVSVIANTCFNKGYVETDDPDSLLSTPSTLVWVIDSFDFAVDTCRICIAAIQDSCFDDTLITTAGFNGVCGPTDEPPVFINEDAIEKEECKCPCDPNDKLTRPEGCGLFGNIGQEQPIMYKVRFQNIGGTAAEDVIIRDPLDEDLDITTLRIIHSDHNISQVQIIPNNALIIEFEGINLPDSSSDPEGSQGFVIFSISPKENLPEGTAITNQAGIYFDRNAVVLTNSTLNTIRDNPFPIADFDFSNSCADPGSTFDFTYTGGTEDSAIYFWDFGPDATPSTSIEQNPLNVSFNSIGANEVTLTITRFGCSSSIPKTVEVVEVSCGKKSDKVLVCHIPPGNPANAHTICISENAVQAHLGHGDCLGQCPPSVFKMAGNPLYEQEGVTIIEDLSEIILDIYPNPFKETTMIRFAIPEQDRINLEVSNFMGQTIKVLFDEFSFSGQLYNVEFHTKNLPKGIYFVLLSTTTERKVRKMFIVK